MLNPHLQKRVVGAGDQKLRKNRRPNFYSCSNFVDFLSFLSNIMHENVYNLGKWESSFI